MPRQRKTKDQAERVKASARMKIDLGLGVKRATKSKTFRKSAGPKELKKAIEAAEKCMKQRVWPDDPSVLVGVFMWAHKLIYRISAEPELKQDYRLAVKAARKLVEDEFDGDYEQGAEYLRWVWAREDNIEKWRKENNRRGKRLTWRLVFSFRGLLTDMRVEQARETGVA